VITAQRTGGREWAVASAVAAAVALLAQVPLLVNRDFYFADDSAAQFLPMWHRLGLRLLSGQWPPLLEPDSWMGGDLAAEALFGVWNPVNLADFALVAALGRLSPAAALVKTQFLVLLGVGVYLLCREYGASRRMAAVLGVALPVSGFVLYFQAASWAGGLIGLAWLPWAWCALRRVCRGRGRVWTAFLAGFLCVSAGDPYAVLALVLVIAGVALESRLTGAGGLRRLAVAAGAVAAVVPLVFWPVVATAPVGWRTGLVLFNVGILAPDLGDLVSASVPGFAPQMRSFGTFRMTVPAMYFTWFAVPLLPWLDFRAFAARWRAVAAPLFVAAAGVLLCLGPSQVWMFRWPLRHLPWTYLALAVVFAVLLSAGLRRDRQRLRWAVTAAGLVLAGYLAFAAWPKLLVLHGISVLLAAVLVAAVLRVRSPFVVLQVGTVLALVLQLCWFPVNRDVADYRFPSEVSRVRADFAALRGGTTVQVADRDAVPPEQIASGRAWRSLLFGNMPAVAGVSSVTAYTGIGHRRLHERLCLGYYGATCPDGYRRLWSVDEVGVPLAEQLNVRHVVVQRRLLDAPVPPPGWRVVQRDEVATRLDRDDPQLCPGGGVSVARGVRVRSCVQHGTRREDVRLDRRSGGELVFARLAWPGYRATVDGSPVPVRSTSAGLVAVPVPAGGAGTVRLSWSPPGYRACLVLAALGAVIALVGSSRKVVR